MILKTKAIEPIPRRMQLGPFPLSAAQTRLWILHQFDRCDPSWNRPLTIHLTGRLDLERLEWSLNEVVRRHEILRTVFSELGGEPVQIVRPVEPLDLQVRNLEYLSHSERQKAAEQVVSEETLKVFDLAHGPLVRAVLFRLDEEDHLLLVLMHHIVFDEWSEGILLRELTALYDSSSRGRIASSLPELPIQYADFSVWQHQHLTEAALGAQLGYWRQRLRGQYPLMIPTDYPRSRTFRKQGARHCFIVSPSLVADLKELCRREQVTLFMALMTGFQIVLSRYTGESDITVGVPIAGRTKLETESLIGYFVNLLPLRVALPGDINFQQALIRVRDSALGAYENQDVPFQRLVKMRRLEGFSNFSPLFQVMFELRNLPQKAIQQSDELRMEVATVTPDFLGNLDFVLEVIDKPDGLNCTWKYAPELFRPGTIERLTVHFLTVLRHIAANPKQRLSEVPLNGETDKHRFTFTCSGKNEEQRNVRRSAQYSEAQVERLAECSPTVSHDQYAPNASAKAELVGKMVQIWQDVLGLESVGVNDNFFEIGGHSLLMIEIRDKIAEILGKEFSVLDLRKHPTIGSLTDYLTREHHE